MSGQWQLTSNTAGATTVTQTAPAGAAAASLQIRVRSISGSVSAAGTLTIQDNAGSPNTYFTIGFAAAGLFVQSDLDIRIAVGLNMVAAFSAGGTGLNVEGDFVPQGYPYGLT